MSYASIISITGNMFALITAILCIACLTRIKHVVKIEYKRPFFILMSLGVVLYVLSETVRNIFEFIFGITVFPSISDIFHIVGALFLIAGLVYFWIVSHAWKKFTGKDWGLLFLAFALSAGYMTYLFLGIIVPEGMHEVLLANILNIFYPIASTLAFIFSYVIHTHHKAGLIRRAYLYLADGIFFIFLGDMFFSYISWMRTYGTAGGIADTAYLLGYLLLGVSFYIFYKKSKP